jgi:hypothetical protein
MCVGLSDSHPQRRVSTQFAAAGPWDDVAGVAIYGCVESVQFAAAGASDAVP